MGKKSSFSKELPEKSTRGYTGFIFVIEPPTCVNSVQNLKIIKNTLFEISSDA
jgi:hypothetical protein